MVGWQNVSGTLPEYCTETRNSVEVMECLQLIVRFVLYVKFIPDINIS